MALPFSVVIRPGKPLHDQVVFAVTKAVVTGHGPASEARLGFRRENYAATQWVRDALLGAAAAA